MNDPVELLQSALEGRYAVERELGQGGMATVYLAQDLRHERKVAIKVLRPELSASLGADRFLREIRVAATLQHPNILGLYDSGEASGLLFYVMPFIAGESLRDRLNREQQLPLHDALQITREAAEALAYAHEHGIIHRDIKPENILLQQGHALVADFGIARAVQASGEKLTQTGMAVGTPHYMSPEQSLGSDHVDARSDVYSLGCVLYELLVGQPPFQGPNAMAIMARHSMEVVPSLQVVRASIPDEVEDAVMQALEKTPADRFQTMRQFGELLSDLEADAALQRTASRRAQARRSGAHTGAQARRTGSRAVPKVERRTPVEVAAAAIRRGGVKFWAVSLAVLIAVAGLGWGALRAWGRAGEAKADSGAGYPADHIAVLYFRNQTGQDSLNFLAEGVTEGLIHELSQVKPLQVISRNGVSQYKKAEVGPDSVARALKVGTIVEGAVAQAGNRLRVTVSLVNGATGDEMASKTLERPREELFALQDDLAKEISEFLRGQLGKELLVQETRAGARDAGAWERYQKAEQQARDADALVAADDTAGAARKFARTDSLLAEAEGRDPKWPAPPTLRGWLTFRQSRMAPSAPPAYHAALIERGLVHARRALALKSDDPEALELRGTLRYWKWLNNLGGSSDEAAQLFNDAEQDLRASVEHNPAQASAWTTLSHLLLNKPATAEAKLAATRAYEADPYLTNANVTVFRLFTTSYQLDDPVEAKRWCEEGQRRFPQDYRFADCQLTYYSMKGATQNIPEGWRMVDKYVELSPPSLRPLHRLLGQMRMAIALARVGLADSARHVAERSRGDAAIDSGRELAQLEAIARWIIGDKDEAFKQLSIWLASNPQQLEALDKDDSWEFRELRADPRFQALAKSK